MRKFLPARDNEREIVLIKQLRTDKPILSYARRSDPIAKDAKKDRSQSREMQTEDMIQWAKQKGWPDRLIHPYFADLGLSGTLRPDQRPDMLRLFDDLDTGKFDHCTIACWQENRLFRDETHIYYNQLIDKMLLHDVVLVVLSPRLYIYDMRDEFDKERLREKLKEAAEFIPRHIKGWLLPARERAAWEDGEWAGMGDLPPGFIVDYDPHSLTYKQAIPYWPHIEKVKEHFELFMELGGEISLYFKHLRETPIVFPEFSPELDRRIISKWKLSQYPGGGYYVKTRSSHIAMLTHPFYWGYRSVKGVIRRDSLGNKILSHEPVIAKELLEFAYYRLAETDFDGNLIERQVRKRFFQSRTRAEPGLVKFRICSDQGEVHVHSYRSSSDKGAYVIEHQEDSFLLAYIVEAMFSCEEIDNIIVKRLLEHAGELCHKQEDIEEYEANAAKRRSIRLVKISQIKKSISDIDKNQGGLTRNLGNVEMEIEEAEGEKDEEKREIKERRKKLIEQEIETLEIERKKLIKAKGILEEEAESDIGTLEEELIKLKEKWPECSFRKRRSLINFAVQEVRINKISTHWIEIQVLWLHEEWGHERMYYRRLEGARKTWSDDEIRILERYYEIMSPSELMPLLPDRTLDAIRCFIRSRGDASKKKREKRPLNINSSDSHLDREFTKSQGIPEGVSYTNWEKLSKPRRKVRPTRL